MFTSMICAPFSTCCLATPQRPFVIPREDELGEFWRTGDVRAFADVHKIGLPPDRQRLQPAQAGPRFDFRRHARWQTTNRFGNGFDMGRRCAATAADDVEPAFLGPFLKLRRERLWRFGKAGWQQGVGQAGIRMAAHTKRRDGRKLFQQRPHLFRPQRAIDSDREQRNVGNRIPKRFDRLPRSPTIVAGLYESDRGHNRHDRLTG